MHPRAFMRITRVDAGRDARYGTPNPVVPRVILNGRDVYIRKWISMRAAVRESTKRTYAHECAKNPHDDADLDSRRSARRIESELTEKNSDVLEQLLCSVADLQEIGRYPCCSLGIKKTKSKCNRPISCLWA
ncbi:hypothetical protein B5X24_HaOG208843 [Helicoverpa armigera]|nr:hypothetical protein B5X24_HaOG208843 [Helicoverpa armigera]